VSSRGRVSKTVRDLKGKIISRTPTPSTRPQSDAVRALLDLAALDLPQAKRLSEKDNWDLSLIDEIQKSGFLDQLYKK
jgi:hypothetical protein